MPDIIVYVAIVMLIMTNIVYFVERCYRIAILNTIVLIFLVVWLGFYYSSEWEYIEYDVTVSIIDDRAITIIDNEIINLNTKFGKNFTSGEKLKIGVSVKNKFYYGIWPIDNNILKIKCLN